MPIDSTTTNKMKQNFDASVEQLLKKKGMHRYFGTDVLNPVQQEVNQVMADIDQVHASPQGTISQVQAITNKGMLRVTNATDAIERGLGTSTTNLGSIGGEMSMLDSRHGVKSLQMLRSQ